MPYTFRVIFHGLCAFIPGRPFDDFEADGEMSSPPGEVTVILRDLTIPPDEVALNVPHHPFLRFLPRDVAQSDRFIDQTFHPGQADERQICFFKGDDLSIERSGAAGPLVIENRRPTDQRSPIPNDRNLLFWLAKVSGQARPDLRDGPGQDIAGRIVLTSGRLRAFELGPEVFHLPNGRQQQLATKIALEFDNVDDDETFTFRFEGFNGAGAAGTVVFGRTAQSAEVVEVEIKNRESIDLVRLDVQSDQSDAKEFVFVYDLLVNPPADRPAPLFLPQLGHIAIGAGPTLRFLCPPVAVEGGFAP
jgi:hypothetical protein